MLARRLIDLTQLSYFQTGKHLTVKLHCIVQNMQVEYNKPQSS